MAKTRKYSEIDAMQGVDAALSTLEDGARKRVMDWAAAKFGIPVGGKLSSDSAASKAGEVPAGKPKDVKSFLAQKKPASFYERVACLAYHLEHFEDRPEFKTEDITKANTDARVSKMTNPALFVKHATHTYGFLTSLGKRKFALSTRGEALVEALPDRAKVTEALTNNPFGKKGRKKAKPKK